MNKLLKTSFLASGAFVALSGSPFAASTLIDGLVNYWNLDNNLTDSAHGYAGSASTVQDDGTFAGANGTDGIAYATGLFGSGTFQDGAAGAAQNNGFINVARSGDTLFGATTAHTANTVSTSFWLQVSAFDTGWQTVVSHGEGNQYRIARRGGTTGIGYAGGVGEGPDGGTDVTVGWHHVVAISDGAAGNTRLFIDGVLESTGGAPVIDDTKSGGILDFNIGGNPDTGAQNREFAGNLDDIAQWGRVITDGEIAELFGGGVGSAQSLGALIPEPTSGLLGLLGLALIFRRRR